MGEPETDPLPALETRLSFRLASDPGADPLRSHVMRQSQDNCLPNSRIVDLSQTCAASVCILGCQVIRSFKRPSAAGASRILISLLEDSITAIVLGTVAMRSVAAATRTATV